MKTLLLLIPAVVLAGCSSVEAYLLGKYDNQEYRMITEIRYISDQAQNECVDLNKSKQNARSIQQLAGLYNMYEHELPHNTDSSKAAGTLNDIAQDLAKRYDGTEPISETYCKLKFGGIANSAKLIQITQGKRPR